MRGNDDGTTAMDGHALSDAEFRDLMTEARAELRRRWIGGAPRAEPDYALRTQHAEFGAAAH
ncbi:hypothetical protein ACFVIY_36010 [Streptomyces sp. NPDC127166]|uniref:hypothetical protein n=1 Tax=Streptomyces sp. NPDC127166 TaxID=3345380 RepID=UPI00362D8D5F